MSEPKNDGYDEYRILCAEMKRTRKNSRRILNKARSVLGRS